MQTSPKIKVLRFRNLINRFIRQNSVRLLILSFAEIKKARREPRFKNYHAGKSIFRGCGFGHDVHAAAVLVELHLAVHERKERPIATRADVLARDEFAAALADDNAARADDLPPNSFTPSRLLTLSRPLRTLP